MTIGWTKQQIEQYALKLAKEVEAFAEGKVKPVLDFLTKNGTATGIENKLPGGAAVLTALTQVDVSLTNVLGLVPEIGQLFEVYQLYKELGGKPMQQGDFDKLEASRGSQE